MWVSKYMKSRVVWVPVVWSQALWKETSASVCRHYIYLSSSWRFRTSSSEEMNWLVMRVCSLGYLQLFFNLQCAIFIFFFNAHLHVCVCTALIAAHCRALSSWPGWALRQFCRLLWRWACHWAGSPPSCSSQHLGGMASRVNCPLAEKQELTGTPWLLFSHAPYVADGWCRHFSSCSDWWLRELWCGCAPEAWPHGE